MKLNVKFSSLYASARKMGIENFIDFSVNLNSIPIDIHVEPLSSPKGVEVPISAVSIDPNSGIFSYQGKHIILFIPDHSFNYEEALQNPKEKGNKFHLTECITLSKMRASGRFRRYFATTNTNGQFEIFNSSGERAEVPLSVCRNCLSQLNYKNYISNRQVFNEFTLAEFFKHYETKFGRIPENVGQDEGGYTEDWQEVSLTYRRSVSFRCEECSVNLYGFQYLLDAHHKNGVKQDNRPQNLKAVCKLCHSLEPEHEHMTISESYRSQIENLRRVQNIT
ncbi:HNH endonuclease [Avibacterium sp. 21-586]|uniref:HNH endonuclease n=1 Tax=Avibacterium sp. 21-586 TaxID=2911534 RepID=UPI0022486FD8|nr:HNH endonuclease [Avibacterium sp. 21-586]MCW9710146.1 HNH endonuclease [Avibacterium sp. 21-586]